MKNLFSVLLVTIAVMITGCGVPNLPDPTQDKVVKIERSTGFGQGPSPGVKFACKSANLDYNGRKITLEGVTQFGSYVGYGWIGNIRIEGDKLILELPSDANYTVYIGKQEHLLPKLLKE